jgi:hypothetical protein
LEDVADGLEAAVRVVGRADRFAGRVLDRPHLIEEQERVGEREAGAREGAPHEEAGPFALPVRRDDLDDLAVVGAHGGVG